MPTISQYSSAIMMKSREQSLQSLGVLLPIRLSPLKIMPGRHPLGRAGDGLRFLRTRPFQRGEDNPRDIDKFSPPDELRVIEWEAEAQASIVLLADVSVSMGLPYKSGLRNATLLQITYSLWRAGDTVSTVFFSSDLHGEIKSANLKTQMERLTSELAGLKTYPDTNIVTVLKSYIDRNRRSLPDMLYLVSDFLCMEKTGFELDSKWTSIRNIFGNNLIPVIISYEVPEGVRGVVKLLDSERNISRLAWFSPSRAREINQAEKQRVISISEKFRAAGLDYLVIRNQRQIYPQLSHLARQRRRRKY